MKPTFFVAALFTAAFALPGFAAEATGAAKADQAATAPAKLHSHVEEKTGVPQKPVAANPAKPDPTKNLALHLHPRDGKQ
ncbi:MAG: hypothetical protein HYU78_14650 [Rhodocyclales bacterium]|nr:hypothetical protein [Rhodocyclales bacterium]